MRVRARARQRGVALPLVISDHADWDGPDRHHRRHRRREVWVTHGAGGCAGALVRDARAQARPLDIVGYGDEDDARRPSRQAMSRTATCMNRFAELLDRLAYEPGRNNKLRLMTDYFAARRRSGARLRARGADRRTFVPARQARHDPRADRRAHRSGAVRAVLRLCRRSFRDGRADVAGALSPLPAAGRGGGKAVGRGSGVVCSPHPRPLSGSGVAPAKVPTSRPAVRVESGERGDPSLSESSATLATLGKAELPAQLARWLDALDETGRWALLKLVTGGLRIGVSARLAKTAVGGARRQGRAGDRAGLAGLAPPYLELFAWLEGRADKPASRDPAPFRPAMLAHAIEETDFAALDPRRFHRPNGNGTASACRRSPAATTTATRSRGFIRAPARTFPESFPDLLEALRLPARSTASC